MIVIGANIGVHDITISPPIKKIVYEKEQHKVHHKP
jgi:hypothetical protein